MDEKQPHRTRMRNNNATAMEPMARIYLGVTGEAVVPAYRQALAVVSAGLVRAAAKSEEMFERRHNMAQWHGVLVVLGLIEWGAAGRVVGADRLGAKPLALKTSHATRPKGQQGKLWGESARACCLVDIALE